MEASGGLPPHGEGTMVQKQQQARRIPAEARTEARPEARADVRTIPEAAPRKTQEPEHSGGSGAEMWLMGALVLVTLAFFGLAGWTVYQRHHRTTADVLAGSTASAWNAATPAAMSDVYARRAVLTTADGTKVTGRKAILASAKALGPKFTMTQAGAVGTTPDGVLLTFPYTYAGHGRGSGVAVVKIVRGKIVRQWNFETILSAPPAKILPPAPKK
jgi:hypothetical protein